MTSGLRERKKEKTRADLARAALRLSAKRGFDHVTVDDIAEACDVSPRTFFRYFGSKEDALFSESEERRASLIEALDGQPPELGPFAALEAAVLAQIASYAEARAALRVRHRVVRSTPSLRTRAAEREHRWEQDLVTSLRSSGRAGSMADLDLRLVVAATMAALRVAVDEWLEDDDADLAVLLDVAFSRLRTGLGAAPRRTS